MSENNDNGFPQNNENNTAPENNGYPDIQPEANRFPDMQPYEAAPAAKSGGKKVLSVIFIIILVAAFFGLRTWLNMPSDKSFSKSGMTITLTDKFTESNHLLADAFYASSDRACVVVKWNFSELRDWDIPDTISVKEFAEIALELAEVKTPIREADGITYAEYTDNQGGKQYSFYSTFHRGRDAYWVVEFYSETKDYNKIKPDFIKYANTVKV